MPKIISIGPHITEKQPLKNWRFCSFWCLYFKNEISRHFQFSISWIIRQRFIVSKNLTHKSQLLLKLWAIKLAILFLSLLLRSSLYEIQIDENSRKLGNTFFWKLTPKKALNNTISLSHREQVCLSRLRFKRYFWLSLET